MKQLRVLHVTPYYELAPVYGGPARSVPLLCQSLVRAGAEVTVLTTDANGRERLGVPLGQPLQSEGVRVHYFQRRWPHGFFYSPELGKACSQMMVRYDVIHIMSLWTHPCVAAARASRRHHKPYVVSLRGTLMPWCFNHRRWKKLPYFYLSEYGRLKGSAGLHCTSYAEKESLTGFGLESLGFVVPNGLDIAEFGRLPQRGALRHRLGIPTDAQVILFMGRLHQVKGIELTLAVFHRLSEMHPGLHLVLVGPDEHDYAGTIKEWATRHGLTARIHLTGVLKGSQCLWAYADADLFILLSQSENFGMSVAEAMACGLPVVVSAEVGISYWVNRWAVGLVVERDLESAVQAIHPILSHPQTLHEMGRSGRRLAASEFSADVVGRQMLEVYHQLVERRQTSPQHE